MTTLKKKIKKIQSIPEKIEEKKSPLRFIFPCILTIFLVIGTISLYQYLLPFINAVDIKKIASKKVYFTDCNTKDFLIVSKDKSFAMRLTDSNCKTNDIEGNIIIKNNEIYFKYQTNNSNNKNKEIKGIIDSNYNILIDNKLFESEKNE